MTTAMVSFQDDYGKWLTLATELGYFFNTNGVNLWQQYVVVFVDHLNGVIFDNIGVGA